MLNLNYMLSKDKINVNNKEEYLLLTLSADNVKEVKTKQQKLNISISIDISGSMDLAIDGNNYDFFNTIQHSHVPSNPWITPPFGPATDPWINPLDYRGSQQTLHHSEIPKKISKLDQAKMVATYAVNSMKIGDIISVTAFDDKIYVVYPATVITEENRKQVIQKINNLHIGGSTDLHGGWLASATEVAKNLSRESINRVLLLTDGETNSGIKSSSQIVSNVEALYEKSITTTTFGIGQNFNEDLLQNMANAGNGNFYYIHNDKELALMFEEEFSGLSTMVATDIKIDLTKLNSSSINQLNKFVEKDKIFKIPNLSKLTKQTILFKLELKIKKNSKTFNLGEIKLSYKDMQGKELEQNISISLPIVSSEEWEKLSFNEEIKVQETLLTIANNKILATQAMDRGDFMSAKSMLSGSINYLSTSGLSLNDNRINAELVALNATYSSADNVPKEELRKSLSYQSYKTRYNKNK